jgi:hypothetical protein
VKSESNGVFWGGRYHENTPVAMRLIRWEKPQTRERACRVSRLSDDARAIETTNYSTKSRSCPLSMGSNDLFLRFEMAVMAKPMNDG